MSSENVFETINREYYDLTASEKKTKNGPAIRLRQHMMKRSIGCLHGLT